MDWSFLVFSLVTFIGSFVALWYGLKENPRNKLSDLYAEKNLLANEAKARNDHYAYAKFSRERKDVYDMIRRYDNSRDYKQRY